jgi:hypothetical protein
MNETFEHDSTEQSTAENLGIGGKIMRSIHALCAKFSRRSRAALNTENTLPVLLDANDSKAFELAMKVLAAHSEVRIQKNDEAPLDTRVLNLVEYGLEFIDTEGQPRTTSSVSSVQIRNRVIIVTTVSGSIYTITLR